MRLPLVARGRFETERARAMRRKPGKRPAWERRAREAQKSTPSRIAMRAFPGANAGIMSNVSWNNFIAPAFVLMMGTRSPAAPADDALLHCAWRARSAPPVFWSLFFIFPALSPRRPDFAVFAKWEVYSNLIGSNISVAAGLGRLLGQGPGWVKIEDINGDGLRKRRTEASIPM